MDKALRSAILDQCGRDIRLDIRFKDEKMYVPWLYQKAQLDGNNIRPDEADCEIWIVEIDATDNEVFKELRVGNFWKVVHDPNLNMITAYLESHGTGSQLELGSTTG